MFARAVSNAFNRLDFMRRKIPSNSALLAFEAAARHGSFARAAEELALTEGAISRRIGRLEAFLGVALFERVGNRVRLAPNGARYAVQVREILDRLERDSLYLMGQPIEGASIDIAAIPTFATRWLIPRLKSLSESASEHHACISPSEWSPSFSPVAVSTRQSILSIHSMGGYASTSPAARGIVPVRSPAFLADAGANLSLRRAPRLRRRQNPDAWQLYAEEKRGRIVLTNSGDWRTLRSSSSGC